jgi:Holliday junction resolvase RusA-like endonuclease
VAAGATENLSSNVKTLDRNGVTGSAPSGYLIAAEPVCRLLLPVPPSTNNLFRNGSHGGRYKTKAYKAWLTEACWEIKLQRPPTLHPPLRTCLRVLIEAPLGPNRDIDNGLKAVLDVLTTMGVYADDKLIDALEIVRCNNCDKCIVSLWPM